MGSNATARLCEFNSPLLDIIIWRQAGSTQAAQNVVQYNFARVEKKKKV